MAVAFVRDHTGVSIKTAGTTNIGVNISTATTAGDALIARILFDNAATASKPVVSSIAKAAGETNNWVFLGAARSTSTSAGAFASGEMWAIQTTVSWPVAAYTVTLDTTCVMKATDVREFSGLLSTMRSTTGSAYSTTTTAASATTTGTTPAIGDLAVGFIFGSNVAAAQAGDTDTTGGAWSAASGIGSTGSSAATNNYGVSQYKILTTASHQTLNNSAAMTAGNGAIVAILQAAPVPTITQAAYQFFDEGTEAGAVALAAVNTNITADITNGDTSGQLRVRMQSTTAVAVPASDDWQLQYEKNTSGTWVNVTTSSPVAAAYDSVNLTAAAATTNRLGAGTGSFVAGEVTEDGVANDLGWTANNYTELLYSLMMKATDVIAGDIIKFRVLRNGATTGLTYTATPQITIFRSPPNEGTAAANHGWTISAVGEAPTVATPSLGSAAVTWDVALGADGARTPKASATTLWHQALTAVGKRTAQSSTTTTWSTTTAAAGKKTQQGTAAVAWNESTTTATGKRAPRGTAAAAHTWTQSAAGVMPLIVNGGAAVVAWSATTVAVGKRTPKATVAVAWSEVLTATGAKPQRGTATTVWNAATAAVGKRVARATATTTHTWALTAAGKRIARATVTVVWTDVIVAAGKRAPRATTATTWAAALTAAGKRTPKATATTTHLWVPAATGKRVLRGSAAVVHTWPVVANGRNTISLGIGSVTLSWSDLLTATGKRAPKAATATSYAFVTGVIGKKIQKATVALSWAEALTAQGKKVPKGALTVPHIWALAATGKKLQRGTATATHLWVPSAVGKKFQRSAVVITNEWVLDVEGHRLSAGASALSYQFVVLAEGVEGVLGFIEGFYKEEFFDAMQYGDRAVVGWMLTPPLDTVDA